jgi:ribonuclease BN (tRNA processing enzyme)
VAVADRPGGPPTLTILGCTGSYPAVGTACSGYLLRAGSEVVLFDAGPGTLANLQRHVEIAELTAVVLSHHHPDHWSDFGVLRTAWRYGLGLEGLRVLGTEPTRDIAQHLVGHDLLPTVQWDVVDDGTELQVGSLSYRFSRTDHYVETMAVRVDGDDWSFAFSGDTGPGWSVEALGDGLTTFLCEATLLEHERLDAPELILHLTAAEAGRMAKAAGVDQLLLTHQPPGAQPEAFAAEGSEAFGAPVEVVREGATYELRRRRG